MALYGFPQIFLGHPMVPIHRRPAPPGDQSAVRTWIHPGQRWWRKNPLWRNPEKSKRCGFRIELSHGGIWPKIYFPWWYFHERNLKTHHVSEAPARHSWQLQQFHQPTQSAKITLKNVCTLILITHLEHTAGIYRILLCSILEWCNNNRIIDLSFYTPVSPFHSISTASHLEARRALFQHPTLVTWRDGRIRRRWRDGEVPWQRLSSPNWSSDVQHKSRSILTWFKESIIHYFMNHYDMFRVSGLRMVVVHI